jgi:cation transport regulator ChaC
MSDDSWYFAYGSNLWIDQKVERTGAIRTGDERPRIARLKDYRLAFNKRGARGQVCANIRHSAGDEVIGVVYRWGLKARQTMGRCYEIGYDEENVEVTTDQGEKLEAVTFVARPENVCDESTPSAGYLEKIITGARQHGLPEEYIRRIEQIAKKKSCES